MENGPGDYNDNRSSALAADALSLQRRRVAERLDWLRVDAAEYLNCI